MPGVKILIYESCVTETQQNLRRIIESNIDCEFKEYQGTQRISQIAKKFEPDLIFCLMEKFRNDDISEFSEFDTIPFISVVCGEHLETQDMQELPPQIDEVLFTPLVETEVLWKTKRLLNSVCKKEKHFAKKNILQKLGLQSILGQAPAFLEVVRKIPVLAESDATILITGETGVGKEVCARAIHYLSSRANKPFIPVNCGAIPASLVENELFGYKKGAFTDARHNRVGMIAEAEEGTLFLDEIEALSLEAQSKFLRLLQEKTYRPLGQTKQLKADLRFIAATNLILKEQVRKGGFRSDLFYRFTIHINLPPLRERKSDIPLLAKRFIQKYTKQSGKKQKSISPAAIQKLHGYDWPGNIRELENIIQEAILFTQGKVISWSDINIPNSFNSAQIEELSFTEAKKKTIAQFEKEYITILLNYCKGNITHAAKRAQKDRKDFSRLIQKYNIDVKTFKKADIYSGFS